MNKTNVGASTNILQILLEIFTIVVAYAVTVIWFQEKVDHGVILRFAGLVLVFIVIYTLSNKEERVYNITLFFYLDRIHRKITKSFLLATASTAVMLFLLNISEEEREFYFTFLVIAYVLVCSNMLFYRKVISRQHNVQKPRTAYLGKADTFNKFCYFIERTSIPLEEVGFISFTEKEVKEDKRYIGSAERLEEVIREQNLDQIYILQKREYELPEIQKYIDLCVEMGVTVRVIIDAYKRRKANSYVSSVGTYPVITYHTISLNNYEQVVKRCLDIVGSLLGIVLASPIMLVTAIAIKMDSPGPAIFKQTRVGQNGRNFKIYKFRSMYMDAEERKKELLAKNEVQGGVMFKIKNDPRITKVGKFIRKTSIDELPQLFNVLGGSMSLVGTRPPTLDEVEKYKRNQWRRISIKPGITGMWQVSGRSSIDNFDEIVELDIQYIDNWDLMLDIKIILKTVLVLLNHKGAY